MQRSRQDDFGYRSNWRNSFHEVSVPSTETDSNKKAQYQNKVDDLEYPSESPSIFAVWHYPEFLFEFLKKNFKLICLILFVTVVTQENIQKQFLKSLENK